MKPWSTASVALVSLLLAACGAETSATSADDPPSTAPTSSPTVTPEPTRWLTTVPDALPLAVGLPDDGGDFSVTRIRAENEAVAVDVCGSVDMSGDTLDIAGWRATGPEYEEVRQLRLYASDVEARTAFRAVVGRVPSCAAERQVEQRPSNLSGDDSVTVVETYRSPDGLPTPGATFLELVRVGNAVLLTKSYGEWVPGTILDAGIKAHARQVTSVVDAMCVFAADPCRGSGE